MKFFLLFITLLQSFSSYSADEFSQFRVKEGFTCSITAKKAGSNPYKEELKSIEEREDRKCPYLLRMPVLWKMLGLSVCATGLGAMTGYQDILASGVLIMATAQFLNIIKFFHGAIKDFKNPQLFNETLDLMTKARDFKFENGFDNIDQFEIANRIALMNYFKLSDANRSLAEASIGSYVFIKPVSKFENFIERRLGRWGKFRADKDFLYGKVVGVKDNGILLQNPEDATHIVKVAPKALTEYYITHVNSNNFPVVINENTPTKYIFERKSAQIKILSKKDDEEIKSFLGIIEKIDEDSIRYIEPGSKASKYLFFKDYKIKAYVSGLTTGQKRKLSSEIIEKFPEKTYDLNDFVELGNEYIDHTRSLPSYNKEDVLELKKNLEVLENIKEPIVIWDHTP